MFGAERFNRLLGDTAALPRAQVGARACTALGAHAKSTPQSDDITLLLLEVPGLAVASRHLDFSFPTHEGLAGRVMAQLQDSLEGLGLPPGVTMELVLVAEEITTNIEKYADLAENAVLAVALDLSQAGVSMEFADAGKPFNPLAESKRSQLGMDIESAEIGGLGLHLITQLTDEQSYRRDNGYNRLRVSKRLGEGAG